MQTIINQTFNIKWWLLVDIIFLRNQNTIWFCIKIDIRFNLKVNFTDSHAQRQLNKINF